MRGCITVWDDERGFGFIEPIDGGPTYFFHITAVVRRAQRPQVGEFVTFDVVKVPDGRICASSVKRIGERDLNLASATRRMFCFVLACLFVLGFFYCLLRSVMLELISPLVIWCFLAVSGCTFCLYGFDKWAAKSQVRRLRESTLQLLALLGGWPGALVAQHVFRHKCRKRTFQTLFWIMVALNCGALCGLHFVTQPKRWMEFSDIDLRQIAFPENLFSSKASPVTVDPGNVPPTRELTGSELTGSETPEIIIPTRSSPTSAESHEIKIRPKFRRHDPPKTMTPKR